MAIPRALKDSTEPRSARQRVRLGGSRQWLRSLTDSFLPPGIVAGPHLRLVQATHRVRVLVAVCALAVSWALPGATQSQRLQFAALVGLVYLPYAIAVLVAARRSEGVAIRLAGVTADLLIVFLFQALLPPTRVVALLGYLLIVAFQAYLGGLLGGLLVGGAAMALTVATELTSLPGQRLGTYTLTMFATVLTSMAFLLASASREQRWATARLSRLHESLRALSSAQEVAAVLDAVARSASAALAAPGAAVLLRGGDGRLAGPLHRTGGGSRVLELSEGCPVAWAGDGRRSLVVWAHDRSPGCSPWASLCRDQGYGSVALVPLATAGRAFGVLGVFFPQGRLLDDDDFDFLVACAEQAAVAIGRSAAEEALRRSEMALAEAQEVAHVGSWEWDIATNRLTWSEELYRIHGLRPGEMAVNYEAFLALVHPDDQAFVARIIEETLLDLRPFAFDHRIVLPDGSGRVLHARGRVIVDESGAATKMVGTAQDITDRNRAEALVAAQAAVLERIAAGEPLAETLGLLADAIETCVPRVRVCITVPDNARQRLVVVAAPRLPRAVLDTVDQAPLADGTVPAAVAAATLAPVVVLDLADDDRFADFGRRAQQEGIGACSSLPVLSAVPQLLGTIDCYGAAGEAVDADDDTLRLLVPLAALALEQEQRERERTRLVAVVENASDFVGMADPSGPILYMNPAGRRLVDLGADDDVSSTAMADYVAPRGRTAFLNEALPTVLRDGSWRGETLFVTRDGREIPTDQVILAHRGPDGQVAYLSTIARDMSADREAEEATRLLEAERRIASSLQHSLLPGSLPDVLGVTVAARYLPSAADVDVGGDWYDVFPLPGGRAGFAVGDVVGRGLGAAGIMGQLRSGLRAAALDGSPPAVVLDRLGDLVESLGENHMATVIYAAFDPVTRSLRFASAGHPPPLLVEPDGSTRFVEDGRSAPLGVGWSPRREASLTVAAGGVVVFYTDGLVERRDVALDAGLATLRAAASASTLDLEALCDGILDATGAAHSHDDVAVLAFSPLPSSPEGFSVTLPAEPCSLAPLRQALTRWLGDLGADDDEITDVLVAFGEAAANVIHHAYASSGGVLEVHASVRDDQVQVTVRDFGQWRPPQASRPGGLGFALMEALMHHVEVDRHPDGTEIGLRRKLGWRNPSTKDQNRAAEATASPAEPVVRVIRPQATGIDLTNAQAVAAELAGAVPGDALGVIVDLSAVTYLDSAGIRALFDLARRFERHRQRLVLVVPEASPIRRVLLLVDLPRGVPLVVTVNDALDVIEDRDDL